jgi:hypothetical protein
VLLRLHIEHELRKRAVQPRDRAAHERKARARQLRTEVKVQAQWCTQIDVILRREVETARAGIVRAPAAHLHIAVLVGADRHAVLRQVRHGHQQFGQFSLDHLKPLGRSLQLIGQPRDLSHHRGGIFALAFKRADLLGQAVALGLQFFGPGL